MSKRQRKQSEVDVASNQSYSFYWNYNEQLAHDRKLKEKGKKRGLLVYVTVLATVFFICFAMLAVTVWWALQNPDIFPQSQQSPQIETKPQTPQTQEQPQTRPSTIR